ncbi:MAG: hypothetical protein ACLSB9_08395 [Hydrogeniiclostridium mannosilyticum]
MRRFMMRIAQRIARRQIAARWLRRAWARWPARPSGHRLYGRGSGNAGFPASIGMDKSEIVLASRKIDAFDISIEPYEDCCTVFTPRHPTTRPELAKVEEAESVLDIDALVEESVQGIYTRKIVPGQTEFDFA